MSQLVSEKSFTIPVVSLTSSGITNPILQLLRDTVSEWCLGAIVGYYARTRNTSRRPIEIHVTLKFSE